MFKPRAVVHSAVAVDEIGAETKFEPLAILQLKSPRSFPAFVLS
jgi:hypothetical protein